jgi:phage terminase large subunit
MWTATPRQKLFLNASEDEVLYGGAAGGGKSDALLMFSIMRRMNIPKSKGLLLRRTFPELERANILRSMELLSGVPGCKYSSQMHRWTFPNKSILEFGYCEKEADVFKYQSAEYEDICFDEATQFTEFQFTYLMSRCRTTKKGVKTLIRAATNPGGVGHAWVKSRFIDVAPWGETYSYEVPGKGGKTLTRTRRFIPAKLDDNPHIGEEYYAMLEQLPEYQRKALKDGDWDIFEGQYFPEFKREIHVIEPFEIPDYWRRYIALDYGLDMLACYWIAMDMRRKAYVYKELYEPNLIISEAARRIKEVNGKDDVRTRYAPPDLWNRRQETGKSAADLFRENGIGLVKANNDRVQGWWNLKEWLKPYDDEQGIRTANLVIFKNCVNLIRCLPQLQRDPNDPNDVADEPHEITHSGDAIRYFLAGRPRSNTLKQPEIKWNFEWDRPKPSPGGIVVTEDFFKGGYN